ncbi:hypothetical protein F5B22DRAFT_274621 [Xylaria bambusicola]|uniref:uncharacterized protein n=1 Tax=Xylaria bambusicola TaxID=326684 RepID=UPI0020083F2F|nr:uncharacterized protein F5B22DRAFT_274621 [Xylaria bambusicola]KAI0513141.1 hypothetical protein F5B22DRAFT_274621 [Xylaria bambusicola]
MTQPSSLRLEPIRFVLPSSLQRFDLFWKFPYDIRHMIWEYVIFTPGIHFLKFVETANTATVHTRTSAGANSNGPPVTLLDRHTEGTRDSETFPHTATLKPIYPLANADNSYYTALNKTLARLHDSCNEAAVLVEKVLAQPGNLTLNDGQLAMLQRSSDVVCIDYPNMIHARHLGHWAEQLDLEQLAKIRRLAVRYHHEWDGQDIVCGYCGRVHSYHGKHSNPRHVYEFAALFKNLKEFYFIDYLTIRSPSRSPLQSDQKQNSYGPGRRFAGSGGGRTYFEVYPEAYKTHTRVRETLSWLRNNYIVHCMSKSQGPARPEQVRFGILGCEWDADQKLTTPKRPGALTTPASRKRSRKRTRSLESCSQNSSTVSYGPLPQPTNVSTFPIVFGDARNSTLNFSLEISH